MAGTAKGSRTGTKKKSPSKSKKQTQTRRQEADTGFMRGEVILIASFALAVLLFLSNFHLCGVAGDYLRKVQLGIFGMIGFLAPVLLFVGTCFGMSNQGNPIAALKMAAAIGGTLTLCGLAEMVFGGGYKEGQKIMDAFIRSAENGLGGGLIGGALAQGLGSVLGVVGTYLILLVVFVICCVCVTEKSLVAVVKRGGDRAYKYAREDADRRRVLHEERKEERLRQKEEKARLREEQRVRGVNLNATKLNGRGDDGYEDEEYGGYEAYDEYEAYDGQSGGYEEEYGEDGRYGGQEYFGDEDRHGGDGYGDDGEYYDHRGRAGRRKRPDDRGREYDDGEEYDDEYGGEYRGEDGGYDDGEYGRGRVRKAVPETASRDMPARNREDVFTGKISLPGDYSDREDDAPFDDSDVMTARAALMDAWQEEADAAILDEEWDTLDAAGPYVPDEDEPYTADESIFDTDVSDTDIPDTSIPEVDASDTLTSWVPELPGEPVPALRSAGGGGSVFDRELPARQEDSRPEEYKTQESFQIPQESKQVVTASGKIIENDTEALKKKLETRRREAVEEHKNENDALGVAARIKEQEAVKKEYEFPPVTLLKRGAKPAVAFSEQEYKETAIKLQQTLKNFGVGVTVTNISCGPSVTRYELRPEQGVKVSKIVGLADDIKLSLAAEDIRIEAPIPGRSAVGIEVPNKENTTVYLREIFESEDFKRASSSLAFAVGKDIGGQVVVTDIAKMPHLLIAGATGSGKSVCINTLIMSLIFKASPDDVKLIMVDPKVVELSAYNGIPHLLIPVVTDPKKASGALNWAVAEMMSRYDKFAKYNVRNLKGYNAKVESVKDIQDGDKPEKMPQIVIIIDELADLMMVSPGEVEDAICRLAQLARAAGIHLVIATQRPSVNVITGLIKANVPSRIAFAVSSGVDSRTIIDMYGAEKLLGKGDMLFYPSGVPKPQRVQGAFVSDQEVADVVEFLVAQGMETEYQPDIESRMAAPAAAGDGKDAPKNSGRDEYFEQAGRFIIEKEKASIGMLQRMYKIGFNRAARIMDQLTEFGVVGEEEGTKPRKVLMTAEEFEDLLSQE